MGENEKGSTPQVMLGCKYTWVLGAQNWHLKDLKKFNWYVLKELEDMTIGTLSINFKL